MVKKDISGRDVPYEVPHIPYPVALHTVDILPYYFGEDGYTYMILGKKPNQTKYQVAGGFVDPTDNSAEDAAKRELIEELNIVLPTLSTEEEDLIYVGGTPILNNLDYVGSFKIDDERYQKSPHKIITSFYTVLISQETSIKAGDDLESYQSFNIEFTSKEALDLFLDQYVVEKHHHLLRNIIYVSNY